MSTISDPLDPTSTVSIGLNWDATWNNFNVDPSLVNTPQSFNFYTMIVHNNGAVAISPTQNTLIIQCGVASTTLSFTTLVTDQTQTALDVGASTSLNFAFVYTNSNTACALTSIAAIDINGVPITGVTLGTNGPGVTSNYLVDDPTAPATFNFYLSITHQSTILPSSALSLTVSCGAGSTVLSFLGGSYTNVQTADALDIGASGTLKYNFGM